MKNILYLNEFLNESKSSGGGLEPGKMELINTTEDQALEYVNSKYNIKEIGGPKTFLDNFNFAKNLAFLGKTQRRDMPVIDNVDIKLFQKRLVAGNIDVNAPFSKTYNKDDPFPEGLTGTQAKDFVERGLKDGNSSDDIINVEVELLQLKDLKPIQKQIYFDLSLDSVFKRGVDNKRNKLQKESIFIVSQDNYIIDGHHRFVTGLFINPNIKVHVMKIHLPLVQLLSLAAAYGDAIGNKRNK